MDRLGHKLVALAVIFITIFIMTALPIKVAEIFYRQGKKGRTLLSVIMCFGGGVFFGTYLLHMTPEVNELIAETITEPNDIHFPVSYTIIGAGFFLMMFLEKGVVELQKWKNKKDEEKKMNKVGAETKKTDIEAVSMRTLDNKTAVYNEAFDKSDGAVANGVVNPAVHEHTHSHHDHEKVPDDLHELDHYDHHDHELGHSHAQGSAAKSIVLLLALSVDCVFEGLSLGLQKTAGGVWKMVLAILSHEIVVAFSLGLQLFKHNTPKRTLLMAFVYGLTCPVGIAIGTAIMEGAGQYVNVNLVYGVLLGLTAGVFIFVTFFEILIHEISHDATMINLLAVLVGFGVMAGLMVVHVQTHSHENTNTTCARGSHTHQIAQWIDSYFEKN